MGKMGKKKRKLKKKEKEKDQNELTKQKNALSAKAENISNSIHRQFKKISKVVEQISEFK